MHCVVVQFHFCRFEAWAVSFTTLCLCLSEETLRAVPFYLVSMPGEVKDPRHAGKHRHTTCREGKLEKP